MNRIDQLFQNKPSNVLSIYFTAGYPSLEDTFSILQQLEKNGVDMVEIGMPFSDPLADGPVIQKSSQKALDNGMSIYKLFQQLEAMRPTISIPVILMGYFNPVMQFGIGRFLKKAAEVGIDGIILPDLPLIEYQEHYQQDFEKHQIHPIFLISPSTSEARIREIEQTGKGFIYMVSSASTTGGTKSIASDQEQYFQRITKLNLKLPQMIGFGISSHESFQKACQYAHGAIIGSAFIKALSQENLPLEERIKTFVKKILGS